MKKINTKFDLIFRYDEALDESSCDAIFKYLLNEKDNLKKYEKKIKIKPKYKGDLPWEQDDTTSYYKIKNPNIKKIIKDFKYKVNEIISKDFKKITYPHFSDLVLWREGKKMDWHKDDGYEKPEEIVFKPRVFSCICYLNDDYEGGSTIIKQGRKQYKSVPKKGSIVFFTSDERCVHKVEEIKKGTRATLAMWFTTSKEEEEEY